MKLQNKLMLGYLLVCVIPLSFVSAFIFQQSARGLEDSSEEFASLYTSQIRTTLNEFLKEYEEVTKSVLVDNDLIYSLGEAENLPFDKVIDQRLAVQRLLMRLALLKSEMSSVMLVSRDDSVYQFSNSTNKVDEKELLVQEWYTRLRDSGETFFITGLHDRSYYEDKEEGAVVTAGRVLFSSDGAYAGMLLIDLDPFTLLQLDHEFILARDKYGISVVITNLQQQIVYHSDAASGRLSWKQLLDSSEQYLQDKKDEDHIVLLSSTAQGELLIRTDIPRSMLLQKINQIKVMTVIVILTSCLVIMLFSFGLSYTITRPIKALRRSMKQAEVGQYLAIEKSRG